MFTFSTSTYGLSERVSTLRLSYIAVEVNISLIHDTSFHYLSRATEWPLNRDILGHAMTSLNKVTLLPERSKPELNMVVTEGGRGNRIFSLLFSEVTNGSPIAVGAPFSHSSLPFKLILSMVLRSLLLLSFATASMLVGYFDCIRIVVLSDNHSET